MDAAAFRFESPAWAGFLGKTLQTVTEDFGIRGKVSAVPYKLLIYGPGGHFKAHRDTEKLDAMFGSLIVTPPNPHHSGRLPVPKMMQKTISTRKNVSRKREQP